MGQIAQRGGQTAAQLRASGAITVSEETKKRCREAQRKRFQRPEELKKLEEARRLSFKVIDLQERAKLMHGAFLEKYGSFVELAKMGLKAPKRRPNKLEMQVAKMLGDEWEYVGDRKLAVGGLIPDFVHKTGKEVLEVLGCYYHSCPVHFPLTFGCGGRLRQRSENRFTVSMDTG